MVDARKEAIDADRAWMLLKGASKVSVAKGKRFFSFYQVEKQKEALLKEAIGPTGNLRAPTYRVGDEFVIGFNPELYEAWLKESS